MRVPAAVAALPLVAGCLIGLLTSESAPPDLAFLAAAAAVLALLAAATACGLDSTAETIAALALGCVLAGVSLGTTAASRAYRPSLLRWFEALPPPQLNAPFVLEGRLREDAPAAGPLPSVTVDVTRVRPLDLDGRRGRQAAAPAASVSGGVRLTVSGALGPARAAEWRAGRYVRVTAFLRLPTVYFDPGVRDERRALARRGIVLVGSVKSAALVDVVSRGSAVSEAAAAARAWTRIRLADAVGRWSTRSAAIATAVLIGDRTGLSDADTRRLQDAGTYHVIAISGGNIAILTVLVLGVLREARLSMRPAALAAIPILAAYSAVVVPAASVQRAIVAALVYLAARVMDLRGSAVNVLAVGATVGIALSPAVLFDPGFLLSFGATLGILAMVARAPAVRDRGASRARRAWHAVRTSFLTTVAAEAALLPIAAVVFGRVTFAGLLLNFAAIPLMTVLEAASLLALALSPVAGAPAAGWVAHLAATGIVESARLTEVLPLAVRDVVAPAWWLIAAYYAAVAIGVAARATRIRIAATAVAVGTVVVIVFGPWSGLLPRASSPLLRVVVLDVGQGDSTIVLLPGGGAMLVDAGGVATAAPPGGPDADGGFDVGARVVAPALRALGVRRLEGLTITHGDPDHIGGAPAILRAFRPPSVWEGVPVPPHPWLRGLSDAADVLGLRWRTVQAGDEERAGPVMIRVLHPALPDWERQRVRNEDSVVLDLRIGGVSIVLPGDIGAEGETAVLPYLQPSGVVVLKAPHHGSATSSTPPFLAALRPAAVVFSAGRNNRFGHPHPAVVRRYHDMGAAAFSTAEDGAVFIETDGAAVRVWGWRGGRAPLVLAAGVPLPAQDGR